MVIPIVGPSKAGKTQTTRKLVSCARMSGVVLYDLDEELGPNNRGSGEHAVAFVQALRNSDRDSLAVLLDVGAGQLVSEPFESLLRQWPGYPQSVVVVWCDETTFRIRHGVNASNEVWRYYGDSPLVEVWQTAWTVDRLVDTSGAVAPHRWAQELERIVHEVLRDT